MGYATRAVWNLPPERWHRCLIRRTCIVSLYAIQIVATYGGTFAKVILFTILPLKRDQRDIGCMPSL
jgi:hypothetical protein